MFSAGGRGGAVIEVTTLDDAGTGSLRAAIQASGARTVVFRVSGTIILNSPLAISNDSITIAGQTAPGDGIAIRRYGVSVQAQHVIIRYLRFRTGDEAGGEQDAFSGRDGAHIIVDHCSASWGNDEVFSFYGNDSTTVQWCIISEGLYQSTHPKGLHSYGGIWGGTDASFHHNLIAHHTSRTPRVSGEGTTIVAHNLDLRNNVIYNWGFNSIYGGEASTVNIVGNYFKQGPATKSSVRYRILQPSDSLARWHVEGNYMTGSSAITANNWAGGVQGSFASLPSIRASTPFPYVPVTYQSPEDAYQLVLDKAGATLPRRDAVDNRIIDDARTGIATYGALTYPINQSMDTSIARGIIDHASDAGGWPDLRSAAPPADTDHDGMPDSWESMKGLDSDNAEDRNLIASSGYTMLEEYLNALTITSVHEWAGMAIPKDPDIVLTAYPNPFNPSTTIDALLPASGRATVRIYDLLGRLTKELVDDVRPSGILRVHWNGTDAVSRPASSGTYIVVVRQGTRMRAMHIQLVK